MLARRAAASSRRFLSTNLSVPSATRPGVDLPAELQKHALERDDSVRKEHFKLPDTLAARRKRLIWRSKQRGWLEVDLLMGTWAVDNVMALNQQELDQYENLLNLETLELYSVVSKPAVEGVPEHVKGPVLDRIRKYAQGFKSDPESYASIVKPKMAN